MAPRLRPWFLTAAALAAALFLTRRRRAAPAPAGTWHPVEG